MPCRRRRGADAPPRDSLSRGIISLSLHFISGIMASGLPRMPPIMVDTRRDAYRHFQLSMRLYID